MPFIPCFRYQGGRPRAPGQGSNYPRDSSAWLTAALRRTPLHAQDPPPKHAYDSLVTHATMSTQELWDFAIIVTGNVAGVAADAIHEPRAGRTRPNSPHVMYMQKNRMMNLSYLAAKLIRVKYTLVTPQSHQKGTIAKRLPALLAQLEHVCTVCALYPWIL